MEDKLKQTKLNAISAKLLHRRNIAKYEFINNVILILTIVVPLIFIIAQYVTVGTEYQSLINILSFILSVSLISVSVLALIYRVNDKIFIHKNGLKNNIYIINECDSLIHSKPDNLEWFFKYVAEMDNQDNDTFPKVNEKTRKKIYRDALKEFEPGNVLITCPVCKSSPWKYKPGDCQLCGNEYFYKKGEKNDRKI